MEVSVRIVSDIEWSSRKRRCHTDSKNPKYSRDQSKTSAQNPTNHSRRYHAKDCSRYFNSAGNVLVSSEEYNLRTIRLHPRSSLIWHICHRSQKKSWILRFRCEEGFSDTRSDCDGRKWSQTTRATATRDGFDAPESIKLCRITEQSEEQSKFSSHQPLRRGTSTLSKRQSHRWTQQNPKTRLAQNNELQFLCSISYVTGKIVRPMKPRVTNAMEEITMLGAASNRRMARKKEVFVTWK